MVGFLEWTETETASLIGNFESGSAEWHEQRNELGVITGSQIGTIMGVNPWESAVTRFYKATGKISDNIEPSMAMKLGTALEAPILDVFIGENPELSVYRTGTWKSKEHDWMRANPDAIFFDKDGEAGIIEVKFSRDYWQDGPPLHYEMQLNWYLGILGLKHGKFVALAGSNFTVVDYEFDELLFGAQVDRATEFRQSVFDNRPPAWDGSNSTFETMRALNPNIDADASVELGYLGQELLEMFKQHDQAVADLNQTKSEVLAWMGTAKFGLWNGQKVCSRQQRGQGLPFLVMTKEGK